MSVPDSLEKLLQCLSVAGNEDETALTLTELWSDILTTRNVNREGLIGQYPTCADSEKPIVAFYCHMDSPGWIVSEISQSELLNKCEDIFIGDYCYHCLYLATLVKDGYPSSSSSLVNVVTTTGEVVTNCIQRQGKLYYIIHTSKDDTGESEFIAESEKKKWVFDRKQDLVEHTSRYCQKDNLFLTFDSVKNAISTNVDKGSFVCFKPAVETKKKTIATMDDSRNHIYKDIDIIQAPFLDNRVGCYIVNEIAHRLAKNTNINTLPCQPLFCATSNEEWLTYGAAAVTREVYENRELYKGHLAAIIVIDVTYEDINMDVKIGSGPVTCTSDKSVSLGIPMLNYLKKLSCEVNKQEIQIEAYEYAGTDAALSKNGFRTKTFNILVPQTGNHTPKEVVALDDIEKTISLCCEIAKRADFIETATSGFIARNKQ